jgi:hypothetical protein
MSRWVYSIRLMVYELLMMLGFFVAFKSIILWQAIFGLIISLWSYGVIMMIAREQNIRPFFYKLIPKHTYGGKLNWELR